MDYGSFSPQFVLQVLIFLANARKTTYFSIHQQNVQIYWTTRWQPATTTHLWHAETERYHRSTGPKPPNRKTVNIHHSPSQNLPFFEIKKLTTSTDSWPNPSHPTPSYSLAATQAPSDHTIHQFQDKLSHRSSVVKFQLEVGLHKSPWQLGVSMGSGDGCGRGFKNVPWMYAYTYIYIPIGWWLLIPTSINSTCKHYVRPPILSDCSNVQKVSDC